MENKIRFGILGCGVIANFHAEAINSLENAVLIGVTDNRPENAQNFAAKYHVKAYESYEAMLQDPEIDAVCICTPSCFHAPNAEQALLADKHVVLEKPMAIKLEDCKKLVQLSKNHHLKLTVISQLRFSPDVLRVKKLLSEDAFGKLVFCDLSMKYWRDPAYFASSSWKGKLAFDGGGALMNQGIHGVDLLLYIAGNAKVLRAENRTVFHDVEVEDASVSLLEFENGALGTIKASTCTYPGFERRIEILGTRGCAVLRENQLEKLIVNHKTLIDGLQAETAGTASDPTAMSYYFHAQQLSNFIKAIFGEEDLLIDAAQGQRAVELIEEIYNFQ